MLHGHIRREEIGLARLATALSVAARSGSSSGGMAVLRLLLVKPAFGIVLLFLGIPAGEHTTEIFRVFEVFTENERSVRIVFYVLIEPLVIREYVIDQRSQEDYVASGAQGHPDVCHRRGARETRVDVNDLG